MNSPIQSLAPLLLAWFAPHARAQVAEPDLWITDGRVRAAEIADDRLYIGGDFSYIGPRTGSAVALDSSSGEPQSDATELGGLVQAVTSDGAGGFYIGGTEMGEPAPFLAHVLADGQLDSSPLPQPDGPVRALLLVGSTLYVGGQFDEVGGTARRRAAAIDLDTGTLTDWNPDVSSSGGGGNSHGVFDLAVSRGGILLAGGFTAVGGEARGNLARVDAALGGLESWNPDANFAVFEVGFRAGLVYLGGVFSTVGGQARAGLAAVNEVSGMLSPWAPQPLGQVRALLVEGNTVYAGGLFIQVNGVSRRGVAAIHAVNGTVLPFDADLGVNSVLSLALDHGRLYVGGGFLEAGSLPRLRLAAVDPLTGASDPWSSNANGPVHSLATDAQNVFAGGALQSVGGDPRGFGAALDLDTGAATDWDPKADGSIVDLAVDGGSVFVVGGFAHIDGALRLYAAEVDGTSAQPTSWAPPPIDFPTMQAVELTDEHVYVGGSWGVIGGQVQPGLARLDRDTGALAGNNIGLNGFCEKLLIDPDADRLYVGGFYETIAGVTRPSLAALELSTGSVDPWDPQVAAGAEVLAITIHGDRVYFGGRLLSVGGQPRDNAAAVSESSGALLPFAPSLFGGDGPRAMSVLGDALYVGGEFTNVNGQIVLGACALDPDSGDTLDWFPEATGSLLLQQQGDVFDIELLDTRAILVGDFGSVFGQPRRGVAIVETLGASVGSPTCSGTPNSTGQSAQISAMGSASVGANDLVLLATQLPTQQNGLFFFGPRSTQVPFGNGVLCVSGSIVRLEVLSSGGAGGFAQTLDLSALPGIAAFDTRHFQAWFRDPAAGGAAFDTSGALRVDFLR